MKATIIITADGKISVITKEGTFEGGRQEIKKLLASLGIEGIEIASIDDEKDFEQHRHDSESHAHLHAHSHNS